jgi:hypothetical protein
MTILVNGQRCKGHWLCNGERANDRRRIALKTNREIPKSEIPDSRTE